MRLERRAVALDASERYGAWAAHVDRPWPRAVALRCRALLAVDSDAGQLLEEAVALHALGGPPFERARTDLVAGEWLRRMRRQRDARIRLHAAVDTFTRLGAHPWAKRARGELRATGESVPEGADAPDLLSRLTPQEAQVVRLAARGLSNREIATQLFLSPRTVGYHLYNAYPKLGVATRGELAATLA